MVQPEVIAVGELIVEIMRKQVQLSQLDYEHTDKTIDPNLTNAVERNELSVERLENQVGNTRAVSPIMGKVTSVSVHEGRTVSGYETAFVVADESALEITADPMSDDLRRLQEEMGVTVTFASHPGEEFPGKIARLPYPYGGGGGTDVQEQDKLTHISLDVSNLDVKPGDLAKVSVTLERKENVLWLPPAAIRTFAGRNFVIIVEEGRQTRVDVTLGIESEDRIELTEEGSNLEEGQVVLGQ